MKNLTSFDATRQHCLLLFFCGFFFANTLPAQTPDDMTDDGTEIRVDVDVDNLAQDFLIPTNTTASFLTVRLDGGDGGRRPSCDDPGRGGKGANIYATFPIGDDDNMLKPGGTLRMIIGQKGSNNNEFDGGGCGGGGGTGLLYLSPDATSPSNIPQLSIAEAGTDWILLAVAGGGGGAFGVPESVGFGNCESSTAKSGTGGNNTSNGTGGGGNNTGGVNGAGGFSGGGGVDGGGGGGYLADGSPIGSSKGRAGRIGGGTGGTVIGGFSGGAGYGGGGAGLHGGGGGGGFSGGGGGNDGGASSNNGGGGGSWLNDLAIDGSITIEGGQKTLDPSDGFISYMIPRLATDGSIIKFDVIYRVEDFTIPEDLDLDVLNAITFTARGGDGGKAKLNHSPPVTGRGGEGALITANFEIGNAPQKLKPGGTLRFIVGEKGESISFENRCGGGGGGGTAVLYKPPGVSGNGNCSDTHSSGATADIPSLDIDDDCWSILLIAGGGGGGYHTGDSGGGRNGIDANTGVDGTSNGDSNDGEGGVNGGSGGSPPGNSGNTVRSGGGGGWIPVFTEIHPAQGRPGVLTGGFGGTEDNNFKNGGFGYGGGGSGRINRSTGLHGGGGGGGYSGGGGGRSDRGGGGGSFVNSAAIVTSIEEAPSSKPSMQGCLAYQLFLEPQTGPVAVCQSIITATINGDGEFAVTPEMVDAGSYDNDDANANLEITLCKSLNQGLTCGFNTFTYHCGNIGDTDDGVLRVSNGTEEAFCFFEVEVVAGDVGTLTCPDPITLTIEDCETSAEAILEPLTAATCFDVFSYQLFLPDGTLDETPLVFDDDDGLLVEEFGVGVHNLSYTATYEVDDGETETETQTCFTTITVVNAPADLDNNICPNDREIEIDKEDWDCSIPVGSGIGPDAYPANLELDYDGCGDVRWQVTSPGIVPIVTTGTGLLESFEFTPGISTVTYFVDIPGAETATCSFTIELYPETNNRLQLNDEEPILQCLGGGNNDIVIADGMTDQEIFDLVVISYSDDCEIIDFEIDNFNDNCAFVGDDQIITVRVWDAIGSISCEVSITVLDEFGLTCPEHIVVDTEPGVCEATIAAEQLAPLTNYLCVDQQTVIISTVDEFGTATEIASGAVINDFTFAAGIAHLIEYSATNDDGHMSDCSFTVTVNDTEKPMAVCQNVSVNTDDDSAAIAAEIGAASTDNCGIASYNINLDLTCENVLNSPITTELTVADAAGNEATCLALVYLNDKTEPEFTVCPTTSVGGLTNQGACNFTLVDFTTNSFILDGIDDECGEIFTLSQFPEPGTLIEEESVEVTLEALDEYGNLSATSCVFTVERADLEQPQLNCLETYTASLNADGEVVVSLDDLVLDITDNCTDEPFVSFHPFNPQTERTYNCSNIGTFDRRIFADDETGQNITFCDVSITVQDPGLIAQCQNATVTLDVDGNGSVNINQIDNGSGSACSTISLSFDENIIETTLDYTCMNLGPNAVVLHVSDDEGNMANCNATVTVVGGDQLAIICQNATVNLDENGSGTLNVTDVDDGSTAGCTDPVLSFSSNMLQTELDYTCNDVGMPMVTLYVSNAQDAAISGSCTATITIVDDTPPFIDCQSGNVILDENGNGTLQAVDLNDNNGSNDACGGLFFSFDEAGLVTSLDFTCDDVGTLSDFVYVTDANGNTSAACPVTIFVKDEVAPMAVCQDVEVDISAGAQTIDSNILDGGSSDNCGAITVSASQTTFDCADLGTVEVTVTISDGDHESECLANVLVFENTVPNAACQNITVTLNSSGTGSLSTSQVNNGSSDLCLPLSFSFAEDADLSTLNYDCDDVGMETVTLYVTDAGNNTSSCTATITIVDDTAPFIDCQAGIVNLDEDGDGTLLASDLNDNNGSSDACGPLHFSFDEEGLITSLDFTCDDIGTLSDFVYVTDANGNTSAACPVSIFVKDEMAPVASCQDVEVILDEQGTDAIDAADFDNGSTDACGELLFSFDQLGEQTSYDGFICADIGEIQTLVYITDEQENQTSCSPNIIIKDEAPPSPVCQNVEVILDENGMGSITTTQVDNGSSDNCDSVNFSFDENISLTTRHFDCEDGLSQVVTLYVTDPSGNTASCTATVSIIDDQTPVVSCPQYYTFRLSVDGPNTLLPTDFANVQDNCLDNVSLSFDQAGVLTEILYDCEAITLTLADAYPVTVYATDTGGNIHNCTTNVRVIGGPQITCANPEPTVYLSAPEIFISDIAVITPGSDPCFSDEDLTLCVKKLGVSGSPWLCEDFTMTCGDVGEDILFIARATNPDGQSSSCILRITVINDLEVEAICQDVDLQLGADGSASVSVDDVDNGTTDACSPLTLSFAVDQELSTLSFTCDDTGNHTATLYVSDELGNTSSCTTTISIEDDEKPTLFCNNIDVVAELASGACDVFVELTVPEVIDNCDEFDLVWRYRQIDENGNNLLPWSLWMPSEIPSSFFIEGLYKIQWKATDTSQNRKRCITYLTVNDPDGLPCPWANNHIDCEGNSFYDYGTEIFTLNSEDCHNPFSNSDDEYAFVSQTICGNAEIIAQVTDISGNSNGWAGVMMRETNDVGSKMATLLTNHSSNHRKEIRTFTNGNMTAQQSSAFNRHWLKLVRVGNSFRGYASSNGSSWFIKFSHTIAMDECIEVGLVLNGYTASSDVQGTFANVSITGPNVVPSEEINPPPLQIDNDGISSFNVYPNPSDGIIEVDLTNYLEVEGVLEILNVDGTVIDTSPNKILLNAFYQVDLSQQPAGVYLVRLRLADGREEVKRVVLQQ